MVAICTVLSFRPLVTLQFYAQNDFVNTPKLHFYLNNDLVYNTMNAAAHVVSPISIVISPATRN